MKYVNNIQLTFYRLTNHDSTICEILYRLYNCLIIDVDATIEPVPSDENVSPLKNVARAIFSLVTPKEVLIFRRQSRYSVHDMLRFSPAVLDNSYLKPLFIAYQILHGMYEIHKRGLIVGDIGLSDIFIDDEFYIELLPKISANLLVVKDGKENPESKFIRGSHVEFFLTQKSAH